MRDYQIRMRSVKTSATIVRRIEGGARRQGTMVSLSGKIHTGSTAVRVLLCSVVKVYFSGSSIGAQSALCGKEIIINLSYDRIILFTSRSTSSRPFRLEQREFTATKRTEVAAKSTRCILCLHRIRRLNVVSNEGRFKWE